MQIKLADFCDAIDQNGESFSRWNSDVGLIEYQCPEFFKNKGYSFEKDEWAFGIVMYKLLTGTFPFTGKTDDEIKKQIV